MDEDPPPDDESLFTGRGRAEDVDLRWFADINVYKSYDLGKLHFENEKGFAFVRQVNAYYHPNDDGDYTLEAEKSIQQLFRNLYYECIERVTDRRTGAAVLGPDGSPETRTGRRLFIRSWIADPRRKMYTDITSDPANTNKDKLCVWPGFAAEKIAAIEDEDEVRARADVLVSHLHYLLRGEQEHVDFLLKWLAFQIQRPGEKTHVAIILFGEQGIGKGMPFEWFGTQVLGPRLFVQTASTKDIMGDYSTALKNKKMCLFDEASMADTRPAIQRIKNMITSPTLNFNPKYQKEFTLKCLVNYVFTTNSANAIPIEASDRRFAAFACADTRRPEADYYSNLDEQLRHPRTVRATFQFLRDHVDLSGVPFDLQRMRPMTSYYEDLRTSNLPWLARWLSYLCWHSQANPALAAEFADIHFSELFFKYKEYVDKNAGGDTAKQVNKTRFSTELKHMCCKGMGARPPGKQQWSSGGVALKRAGGATRYQFHFGTLTEHLKQFQLYDESS